MNFIHEDDRIYLNDEDGNMIAEITFPKVREGVVDINHTYVSSDLRGHGIAGKLMEAAIEYIEKNNCKAILNCSYAASWGEKHPEKYDLFVKVK